MSPRNEIPPGEIATQNLVTTRYFSSLKRRLEKLSQLAGEITNEAELDQQTRVWVTKNLDEVENFLKEARKTAGTSEHNTSPARARREFIERGLKQEHMDALEFLDFYKYATTGQIRKYLGIERATHVLAELEKVKMVMSYRYQPERGRASEKCWWLWYAGAKFLSATNEEVVRYDPRLAKQPPSLDGLKFRGMEMELYRQLWLASHALKEQSLPPDVSWEWDIIPREEFNSTNPKPQDATDQGRMLSWLVQQIEWRLIQAAHSRGEDISRQQLEFEEQDYLNLVPFHANHHLIFIPDTLIAVVLILCPLDATSKFWAARVEEYADLTARIPVYGVFYDQHHASAWLDKLEGTGIGTVIPEKIAELLNDLVASFLE